MIVHLSARVVTASIAGLFAVAVVVLFWFLWPSESPDSRPIAMPETFLGLNPYAPAAPETLAGIRQDLDGAEMGVTSYGKGTTTMISVLAVRTDLTGKVDLRMLNDDGQAYGGARCTRNLSLRTADEGPDDPGSPYPGKMTCWRTSDRLSVSAFVLNDPPSEQELAAAVDALWGSLR